MLAETCLVILALCVLSSLYLSMRHVTVSDFWTFGDDYLCRQAEAMASGSRQVLEEEGTVVEFNENGHVRQAGTIAFGRRKIIIELGGGRLVHHE